MINIFRNFVTEHLDTLMAFQKSVFPGIGKFNIFSSFSLNSGYVQHRAKKETCCSPRDGFSGRVTWTAAGYPSCTDYVMNPYKHVTIYPIIRLCTRCNCN
jgi:hypothetical protein